MDNIERLRKHYPDMADEEIEKANTMINYALYDKTTGEITQTGDMDLLAFESFEVVNPDWDKMIVENDKAWTLRGEFVDDEGKRMFKVNARKIEAKPEHEIKIAERKMPKDKDLVKVKTVERVLSK